MSIWITGDCHGEFNRFNSENMKRLGAQENDYFIICGDFGLWHDTPQERYNFDWLESKPYTYLFVDGNHENFNRLFSNEFPTINFGGSDATAIRRNIIHLRRGKIYNINNKSFFCMGGAPSYDISDGILDVKDFSSKSEFKKEYNRLIRLGKMVRAKDIDWWEQEIPTNDELDAARILKNRAVDYIITHDAPANIRSIIGYYDINPLSDFFSEVYNYATFNRWYCGHYHINRTVEKVRFLYKNIELLE